MGSTLRGQTKFRLIEYKKYWKSQVKEIEGKELIKKEADAFRFRFEESVELFSKNNETTRFEEVEIRDEMEIIRNEVMHTVAKGEARFRTNETERTKKKYGVFAPVAFFFQRKTNLTS